MKSVAHNLPSIDTLFVNRSEEVEVMRQLLWESRYWLLVLTGEAGVGKTALALHMAYQSLEERAFDCIIWNTAKAYELGVRGLRQTQEMRRHRLLTTLDDLLNTIGRVLGERRALSLGSTEKREYLHERLRNMRALIIVDNLDTVPDHPSAEIINFIGYMLPEPNKVIITTRFQTSGKGEYELLVPELDFAASALLMRESARALGVDRVEQADDTLLRRIYDKTRGVPLLMKWIVGQLYKNRRTVEDVLDDLTRASYGYTRLDASLARPNNPIWEYCFRAAYEELLPEARQLLQTVSLLDPPLTIGRMQQISGLREYQLDEALDDLVPMSLMEYDVEQQVYELHDMTKAFARAELAKDQRLEQESIERYQRYFTTHG